MDLWNRRHGRSNRLAGPALSTMLGYPSIAALSRWVGKQDISRHDYINAAPVSELTSPTALCEHHRFNPVVIFSTALGSA